MGKPLDHSLPMFIQWAGELDPYRYSDFKDIRILSEHNRFGEVRMTKVPGRHGTIRPAGPSCGIVFQHPEEPTVYLTGDTIWYEGVEATIKQYHPDVIIVNACAANMLGYGRLIMDDGDVYRVHEAAPEATIVAVHMDNVSHLTLNRSNLARRLKGYGIMDSVRIPEDGEILEFSKSKALEMPDLSPEEMVNLLRQIAKAMGKN